MASAEEESYNREQVSYFAELSVLSDPTEDLGLKWQGPEKALDLSLGAFANLEDFSNSNSVGLGAGRPNSDSQLSSEEGIKTESSESTYVETEAGDIKLDKGGIEDAEIIAQESIPAPLPENIPVPETLPAEIKNQEVENSSEQAQSAGTDPLPIADEDTIAEPEQNSILSPNGTTTPESEPLLPESVEADVQVLKNNLKPEAVEQKPEFKQVSNFLELWHFSAKNSSTSSFSAESLESLKLNVSMAGENAESGKLDFYIQTLNLDWQEVASLELKKDFSNQTNGGYYEIDVPSDLLGKLKDSKVRVVYSSFAAEDSEEKIYLDSVWFEAAYKFPKAPEQFNEQELVEKLINPEEFIKMQLLSETMEVSMPGDLQNPITLGFSGSSKNPDLKMLLAGVNASSTAQRTGEYVKYQDVFKSTDVEYKITKKGLKENIILKDASHPKLFRYAVNFSDYDMAQISTNQINLYEKGHKDEPLKLLYKITAPYMEDAAQQRSENLELRVVNNILTVVPDSDWLKSAAYPVYVDPSVEINVLNVHSHPVAGQFWDVDFTTLGTADLTITPADQATIVEDEFFSLFCGSEDRTESVQILPGDVIYYPAWSCGEVARVSHMTLVTGNHHLYFQFGDAASEAFNAAYVWDGGGGDANWTTAANWSSNIVPTSVDTVTFNNSCASNCNPVINTTTAVSGMTISSATTTVTLSDGFTLTIGNSGYNQSNGTFNGGVATTSIGGTFTISGGTFNAPSTTVFAGSTYTININTTQNFHHLAFNGTSGTAKTISTGDTLVALGDLYLTDSIVNLSSYASPGIIDARGNITVASSFDGGTAIVDFGNDSLAQTWTANGGTGLAFRLNSGADASDSIVINAEAAFQGATITPSFSGTIPISNPSNYDLTFGSSATIPAWAQAAGTFNGGAGTTTFANSSFTISGGTFNAASNTVFSGISSSINVNSSQQFYNLHVNANSLTTKTISSGNVLEVNGTLYLNSGNLGGGTVKAMGDIIQNSSMEGSTAIVDFGNDSLAQTWTVNGGTGPVLRLDSAADAGDVILINSNGGFYGATISPDFVGVIPFSNSGAYNVTFSTGGYVQNAGIFNGWAGTTTVSGAFTIAGGTYNASTNTVVTGLSTALDFNSSQVFYNFSFSQNHISGKSIAAGDTLIVLNNLAFNDGQVSSSGIIEARGNVKIASNFDGGNTALRFTGSSTSGSADQTFDLGGTNYLYDGDITINKSEGEVRLLSNLLTNATNQDIIITSGTLNLNGYNLSATGTGATLIAQGGTLKLVGLETVTANANYPILAPTSTVEYYGTTTTYNLKNFTYGGLKISGSGGTFRPGSTTLNVLGDLTLSQGIFNASSTTNIYGNFVNAGGTFNHNNNTVSLLGGNQTIFGSNTFYNLSKSTSTAYTLTFASGTTQTILNSLTLEGASGQQLNLRSDTNGSYWYIDPQGSRTVSYLNVQDSYNSNLTSVNAIGTGSTNLGNNINWDFGTSYEQSQYQFYQNTDALQPVTSIGSLNSTTTLTTTSSPVRLRLSVTVQSIDLATSSQSFILQFATSTSGSWTSVGTGQAWQFYNNPSVANTTTISSLLLPAADIGGLYMESNPTGLNPNFVSVGQDIEFDFVLNPANAGMTTYLFRMVRSDGALFSAYNNYAALTLSINSTPNAPSSLGPASLVNGYYTSSTQPTLNFTLSDADASDTLKYQVQISTTSNFSRYVVNYISSLAAQGTRSFTVGQPTGSGQYLNGSANQVLPSANYYWRVFAIDNSSATSSTSTARSGFIAFQVSTTSPNGGTLAATSSSTTSMNLSISGASDSTSGLSALPYVFYNSTAGTGSGPTSSASWLSTGLLPNTAYTFYADVYNNASNSASSTSVVLYTLAEPPSGLVLTAVSKHQISASWSGGNNPSGTDYILINETEGSYSAWMSATSTIVNALECNTEYVFSVKAINGDDFFTEPSASSSVTTLACDAPSSGGGSSGGGGGGTGGGGLSYVPLAPNLPQLPVPPVILPTPQASPALPISVNPSPSFPAGSSNNAATATPPASAPSAPPSSSNAAKPQAPTAPARENGAEETENILERIAEKLPEFPEFVFPDLSQVPERISEAFGNAVESIGESFAGLSGSMKGAAMEFSRVISVGYNKMDLAPVAKIPAWISNNWPQKSEMAQGIVLLTFVPGLIAAEYSIAANGLNFGLGSFYDLWLSLLSMAHGLFTSLGLRKRRRIWGTVYDSQNKQPLDPAMVTLIDAKTGKVVQSSITDLYGRFGFLDKPGEYVISAKKTHYQFPSIKISGKTDGIFSHLYHGERVLITPEQELLVPNVPMDPLEFDWNQEEKNKMLKFNPRFEYVVQIFLQIIFWSGFGFTVVLLLRDTTVFNSVLMALYLFMAFLRRYIPHRHLWGRVSSHGESLEGLLLELTHPKIQAVVLARAITSKDGKFFLKAQPGEYTLKIKRVEGDKASTLLEKAVKVNRDGVVNEDIKI